MSINALGRLALAVAAAYGVAVLLPLFRGRDRRLNAGGWCLVPVVFACPLLVPAEHVGPRAAAMFIATDLMLR
jgi:hypothetical protein